MNNEGTSIFITVRHSLGQLQWDLGLRNSSGTEEDSFQDKAEVSKIICLPKRLDDIKSDNVTIIVRYTCPSLIFKIGIVTTYDFIP